MGFKPTVGLTSRAGVIPESEHQDSVGTFARTVGDAALVLDAIYGVDERDNYTLAQKSNTPHGGYAQFLASKSALKGAVFGLPWNSFWALADDDIRSQLVDLVHLIQSAGATIINGTEITNYETIVSPDGWNWDYGTARGYINESEYSYINVDFYRNIESYLSEVTNTNVKNLHDIVEFNKQYDGTPMRMVKVTRPLLLARMAFWRRWRAMASRMRPTGKPSNSASPPHDEVSMTP